MEKEIVDLSISLRELQHHLRTSLTGILGSIYLLKDEPLTSDAQSYVDTIKMAGEELLNLTNYLQNNAKKIKSKQPSYQKILMFRA